MGRRDLSDQQLLASWEFLPVSVCEMRGAGVEGVCSHRAIGVVKCRGCGGVAFICRACWIWVLQESRGATRFITPCGSSYPRLSDAWFVVTFGGVLC